MNSPIFDAILRFVVATREAISPDILKCSCGNLGPEREVCEFHLACEDAAGQLREAEKMLNDPAIVGGSAMLAMPMPRPQSEDVKYLRTSGQAATIGVAMTAADAPEARTLGISFACGSCQFEIEVFQQRPKSPLRISCPSCEAKYGIFLTIVRPGAKPPEGTP